jgi:hypothetical protein
MDTKLLRKLEADLAQGEAGVQIVPGRNTATSRLVPRSQIILRVEDPASARALGEGLSGRDSNGVAAGAEGAVSAAASSSGRALPGDVRERFESSLGADLSGVRVHTGSESAGAAHAVGARAYTTGQDIHFADGQFQPGDPFGLHLLAHEVAHTVQQSGGATAPQYKLEVSTPGDAQEVEADRAADAMVSGAPATVGVIGGGTARKVMRGPNNSYSAGEGLKWEGGTALTEQENADFVNKAAGIASKGAGFAAKKLGLDAAAVIKGAKKQVDQDISDRTNYIANLDSQIKQKKKDGADTKELETLKASEEAKLAAVKGGKDDLVTKATGVANSANELLSSVAGAGKAVAGVAGGKIDSTMFKSAGDFSEKVQKLTDIIDGLHQASETDAALTAFQAHPDFNSAAAWGASVGAMFGKLKPMVSGLPAGWGTVISGALDMPTVVIAKFTQMSRSYYARVDEMTKDPANHGSKILGDGESG